MAIVYGSLYLAIINLVAFMAFVIDKIAARKGWWRISEASLLRLAAIGGMIGAVLGQRVMRHKTRKEPFRSRLRMIAVLQLVGIAAILIAVALKISPQG